jgi:hypothetical protein
MIKPFLAKIQRGNSVLTSLVWSIDQHNRQIRKRFHELRAHAAGIKIIFFFAWADCDFRRGIMYRARQNTMNIGLDMRDFHGISKESWGYGKAEYKSGDAYPISRVISHSFCGLAANECSVRCLLR